MTFLKIFTAIFFLGASTTVFAAGTPTQAEVEKVLTGHFTNTDYATRVYELKVESVQRGSSRTGNYLTDGTPANKPTQVIPCKVVWTLTTTYAGDPKVKRERYTGEYVFFRDEFGDWTFRIKNQKSEKF